MKRVLFLMIIFVILFVSCQSDYILVNIKYNGNSKIMKNADVYLGDKIIGKVYNKDEKNHIIKIGIIPDYKKDINTETMFFVMDSKNKIIVIPGESDELLENNASVKAHGELEYNLYSVAIKVVQTINDFLHSDEIKNLKINIKKIIDGNKKGIEKDVPEIDKAVNDFLNNIEKKYGKDFEKKIKPKIDSIVNALKLE